MDSWVSQACILLVLCSSSLLGSVESREVVCYYGTWAAWRAGNGKLTADRIDPFLCTQLVFSFVNINPDGSVEVIDADVMQPPIDTMGKFYTLKQQNPSLKTLVAVGGWNAGTQNFATVAADPQLRVNFAQNAVAFLQQHRLDGMDIDWEYPAAGDRANFVLLLEKVREAFDPHNFLLTIAVGATEQMASVAYDIPAIAPHVHFINLMEYDMHNSLAGFTGHHAPLYAATTDEGILQQTNVLASVKYWLSEGAPAAKLTVGVPLYGRTFTMGKPIQRGVAVPILGPGRAGPITGEPGFLGYNEICANGWWERLDRLQMATYASRHDQWVSYDTAETIERKCDLIAQFGLAGGMVWSIDTDDFRGKCGRKFQLLHTLKQCVDRGVPLTTVEPITTQATTLATTPTTTVAPQPVTKPVVCLRDGWIQDPNNCAIGRYCQGGSVFDDMVVVCNAGSYYNAATDDCPLNNGVC